MASRRIRFLRTTVRWTALPTRVSRVTARAVARQVVSVSGKLNRTCACSAESVVSAAAQKAGWGKALRTRRLDEGLGLELRQVRAAGIPANARMNNARFPTWPEKKASIGVLVLTRIPG